MRDMKRRHMTKDYAVDRARWMSLLRAEILPKDLHVKIFICKLNNFNIIDHYY